MLSIRSILFVLVTLNETEYYYFYQFVRINRANFEVVTIKKKNYGVRESFEKG
jgi:hypothetical protein